MRLDEIKDFLINYGVNEKCKGFEYAIDMIDMVQNEGLKKNKDIINRLSKNYNVSYNTIREELRYAITLSNKYGGRLTIKDLVKIALQKDKERKEINVFN